MINIVLGNPPIDLKNTFDTLNDLFLRAKEVDEFEFICTLIRVRGLEGPGWDPLVESNQLINQVLSLVQ